MKCFLYILFIFKFISFIASSEVDIKSRTISDTVRVYHGHFMFNGKYMMLIGYESPISKVTYGDQDVFPFKRKTSLSQECLVEIFERNTNLYVVLTVMRKGLVEKHFSERIYYRLVVNRLAPMDKREFLETIESPIFLNFDVKPGHKHPFIHKDRNIKDNYKIVEYTIGNNYYNMAINTDSGVNYRFGTAYDSSVDAMVGLKLFDNLMKQFDSVKLYYGLILNQIEFKIGTKVVTYKRTKYFSRTIWNASVENYQDFGDLVKSEAYMMLTNIENKSIKFENIMIDISEIISPRAFFVEKTVGTAGSWEYALYQVSKEFQQHFKIKKVIDTKSEDILIWTGDESAEETIVERYKFRDRTMVVISSFIPTSLGYTKEMHIFDKMNRSGVVSYKEYLGEDKEFMINTLDLMMPIAINIMLEDPPTAVYNKEICVDENGVYKYFTINEADGKTIDSNRKYVFGDIHERKKYESGNIPTSSYGVHQSLVVRMIKEKNVIITNSRVPQCLSHMEIGRYATIYKKDIN